MFEDATFHSGNSLHTQTPRWLLTALAVNLCLLATMIAMPIVFPEGLSPHLLLNQMYVPPPPLATHHETRAVALSAAIQPLVVPTTVPAEAPVIQRTHSSSDELPPTIDTFGTLEKGKGGSEDGATGQVPVDVFRNLIASPPVKPAIPHPVRLTSTMIAGLLLSRTTPVYPSIAKATGTSGSVVLAATISTTGSIENLRVVSGSPMLRQAALDAVKTWRYRPYMLNNQPVEVETTINVVFSLGGR